MNACLPTAFYTHVRCSYTPSHMYCDVLAPCTALHCASAQLHVTNECLPDGVADRVHDYVKDRHMSMTHDHQEGPHFVIRVHSMCQSSNITNTRNVFYTLCVAHLEFLHSEFLR